MKNIYIFCLLLFLTHTVDAQLRYKKVYAQAMSVSKEEAFDLFKEFQQQEPKHVNTYYQLALLSSYWMQQYNPILQYSEVALHTYNAKLYFGLAKYNLTERNASEDDEFYQTIVPLKPGKMQYADIKQYLDSVYAHTVAFKEKSDSVYHNFQQTIDYYNKAVERYKQINNRNPRYKDMLLGADDALRNSAKELKSNYDSALFFYYKLRTELDSTNLIKLDQKLIISPISTFRLEGLSAKNFVSPELTLYNYGAWADSLFVTLDTQIASLRNNIADADAQFDKAIQILANPNANMASGFSPFRLTNVLRYQVGKFDNNSIALDWFEYRDQQVDLFLTAKRPELNPNDTTNFTLLRRLKIAEPFITKKLRADSLVKVFDNHIQELSIAKYAPLFIGKYDGIPGLKRKIIQQRDQNDSLLQQTLTKVENFWMADPVQHGKPDYTLRYNTQTIPSVQNLAFADVAINSNVSLASDTDPEGGNYIVGLQKTSETGGKLYIGLTTDGLNLTWLRKPNIKGLREVSAVSIQALRKGCVILVQGKWTGSDIQANVFVRFDEFGNEQVQTPMQSSARPCFLYYDDINETILSAYKGKNAQSVSSDTLQVYMNKTDGTPIWAQQYPLQGTLAGISRMDKQYIFFFNFTKYRGLNGDLQTKANGSNLLAVFVPDNGIETQAPVTIGAEQAFEISRVEKLNSSTICVLGHTGTNKKMVYMLLNAEGKLQYSNL